MSTALKVMCTFSPNEICTGENPDDPRVPVQRCHSSPEMSEGVVVGPGGISQKPPPDPENRVLSSPSTSPGPSESALVTTTSRQGKAKPRFVSY